MGKIILNTSKLTPKQKRFVMCRKATINNIKKDCKSLGYSEQKIQELEKDFL